MYTKLVSKKIQQKLKAKERALARKTKPSQESTPDDFLELSDLASRTVFVRMCSNKSEVDNILISGGEQDEDGISFGFNKTYRKGSTGIRGIPGIKDINVEYKGGFKAIRECVVNWSVPSIDDLDALTPYFLTVGKTVVVDWGWVNAKNKSLKEQGISPFIIRRRNNTTNEITYEVDQEIFTNPQQRVLDSAGDYDAIGGQVTNFNYTLRDDGGFDCTTTIISLGSSLFKKPIDEDGNSVGTRKTFSTSKPKYDAPDNIINCILNLKDIIVSDVFGANKYEYKNKAALYSEYYAQEHIFSEEKNFTIMPLGSAKLDSSSYKYGIAADDKENPNVLYTIHNGVVKIMVTWGWFEDQILNRYLSFNGGSEDGSGVKMTMRSIDTVLDDEGKPITKSELEDLDFATDEEYEAFKTKYDVDLDNIIEYDSVLKRETLIRNTDLLLPNNVFSFFTLDSLEGRNILDIKNIDKKKSFGIGKFIYFDRSGEATEDQLFFKNLFSLTEEPNGFKFKKKYFKSGLDSKKGKLRNIWMNIDEIQKAFGVKDPKNSKTNQDNVTPPGTFENAINILLNSLNSNFHSVWDFDLVVDQYDSTNLKIIDKSDTENDNPLYTTYLNDNNSHKVQNLGIFQFPSFQDGSIVKNQTLEFKIPSAQAISILYGSNRVKGESSIQSGTNFDKLFRSHQVEGYEDPYTDKFLKNLETSNSEVKPKATDESDSEFQLQSRRIGNLESNPNSPVTTGYGINFSTNNERYKWRKYYKDGEEESKEDTKEVQKKFIVKNGQLLFEVEGEQTEEKPFYKKDGGELKLLPEAQGVISSYLNASSPMAQFDLNSLIPAELGLEIDGTGGILPGDIVHTKYIQNVYKDSLQHVLISTFEVSQDTNVLLSPGETGEPIGSFERIESTTEEIGPVCYFQVVGTTQKVDSSGWTTEIKTLMRMNKLPNEGLIEFQPPADRPKPQENKKDFTPLPEAKRPFVSVPSFTDVDIEGDVDEGDTSFNTFPAPHETLKVPLESFTDVDIEGDEDLEDLEFDDIPSWTPPPFPSTIDLRNARAEIELQPESVPEPPPPDVPLLDVGPIMSEEDFLNPPDNLGQDASNNPTDLLEYPIEPEPTVPASQGSAPVVGNPPEAEATSKEEQLQTQKIIYVHPSPELTNETGQVPKAQRFETPIVEEKEIDYGNPTVATIEVNKNIRVQVRRKATLPPSLIMGTQEVVDLKSTYRGTKEQNEILYSIREDWRPLYLQANGKPGGSEKDSNGNLQTLLRERLSFSTRQRFWDQYIEEPNRTGVTKATKNTLYSSTPIPKNLMRTQRSIYWRGSFNPNYSGS
tara:strand:- start:673 stop:4626 length:3954 start_codon:yes stop_codon:yes gene_type:complete